MILDDIKSWQVGYGQIDQLSIERFNQGEIKYHFAMFVELNRNHLQINTT